MVNNINQWTYEENVADEKITDMDIAAKALKNTHPDIFTAFNVKSGLYNPDLEKLILYLINMLSENNNIYNEDNMIDYDIMYNLLRDYINEDMLDFLT